jgi:hypothetical protein
MINNEIVRLKWNSMHTFSAAFGFAAAAGLAGAATFAAGFLSFTGPEAPGRKMLGWY